MCADGVGVVPEPGLVHQLQIGEIVHSHGGGAPVGRQRAADDNRARAGPLDRAVGRRQQPHVAGRIQRFVAPLIVQVLFVPDLDGLDAAAIARGEFAHE